MISITQPVILRVAHSIQERARDSILIKMMDYEGEFEGYDDDDRCPKDPDALKKSNRDKMRAFRAKQKIEGSKLRFDKTVDLGDIEPFRERVNASLNDVASVAEKPGHGRLRTRRSRI